jgi:uncharacterized protein YcsI (UPF0317 family)
MDYGGMALEEWAEVLEKKEDALKIVRVWTKRGGNGSLFRDLAEDNDAWDEDYVDFIIEKFFADEGEKNDGVVLENDREFHSFRV